VSDLLLRLLIERPLLTPVVAWFVVGLLVGALTVAYRSLPSGRS
jgi:hypothetical protein